MLLSIGYLKITDKSVADLKLVLHCYILQYFLYHDPHYASLAH